TREIVYRCIRRLALVGEILHKACDVVVFVTHSGAQVDVVLFRHLLRVAGREVLGGVEAVIQVKRGLPAGDDRIGEISRGIDIEPRRRRGPRPVSHLGVQVTRPDGEVEKAGGNESRLELEAIDTGLGYGDRKAVGSLGGDGGKLLV